MSEYITLLGAEDVQRAANRMRSSAEDMLRAANIISESQDRFILRFEELVVRQEVAAAMMAKHDNRSIFEIVFGKS